MVFIVNLYDSITLGSKFPDIQTIWRTIIYVQHYDCLFAIKLNCTSILQLN